MSAETETREPQAAVDLRMNNHSIKPKIPMFEAHIEAFSASARRLNVTILVRRINTASLQYVGKDYAVPKRIDCKPKTANHHFIPSNCERKEIAGLVVDPTIVGKSAYKKSRYKLALREWKKFRKTAINDRIYNVEALQKLDHIPDGGKYFVELRKGDPFFGCVKYTSSGLISDGKVIHGDYDLYAIIPMSNPSQNYRTIETLDGQNHAKGRLFNDVQESINNTIGISMVMHGSREKIASKHSNEKVDMFLPNGQIHTLKNKSEIKAVYRDLFCGRTLFGKGVATKVDDLNRM